MQHARQRQVERTRSAVAVVIVHSIVLMILHDHERVGILQELLTLGRNLQQSVVLHVLFQETCNKRLANDGIPNLRIAIFARAELFQILVLVSQYLLGVTPRNKVDDVIAAEVFLDSQYSLQGDDQLVAGLDLRRGMQTVVAVAAVILGIFLAEIVQQHLSPANRCLGIGGRLLQQLSANVLLSHRLSFHKLVELLQVLVAVEGDADALATVTAGTACLLIIPFERLRDIVVDDEAHIGFVDTHAKGYGGHDDIDFLHEEVILGLRTRLRVETGVVALRLDVVGAKHLGQVFHLLSRQAVDDAALARMLFDEAHDVLINVLRLRPHFIVEVRPVERRLKLLGIENAQILLDVGAHLVGGRGGERDNRGLAYFVHDRPDAPVLRTEVVSPLRDTVCLVDGIERNLARLQELHVVLLRQRLRCHVQQFRQPRADVVLHLVDGRLIERRVQVVGHALMLAEVRQEVHLVFHEGDEGRDDDGHPIHEQRRQLVAQRLAATRRHQYEGVLAIQHIADDGFLVAFERVKAEIVLQGFRQIVSVFSHRLSCNLLQMRRCQLFLGIVESHFKFLNFLRRHIEHGIHHDTLNDRAQSAGSEFVLHGLVDDEVKRLLVEHQVHAVHLQQLLILLHDAVLRLQEDALQGGTVQRVQIGEHGQSADDLGYQSERLQVLRLNVFHQVVLVNLPDILHRVVAHGVGIQALRNLPLNTVEGTTADEQDVTRIDNDIVLIRVLSPTLWRHVHIGTFKQFQKSLLNALATDIAGNRGVVGFTGYLVNLVDEHDTTFCCLHVVVGHL